MKKELRKEKDFQNRCSDIQNAAEIVFAEKGYANATMEEIADECGYATGTLYRYFSSKEELYYSILESKVKTILIETKSAIGRKTTVKNKILAALDVIISFYENNPLFFIIYVNETNGFELNIHPEMNNVINDKIQAYLMLIQEVFEEGIKSDEIMQLNTHVLSLMFVGFVNSLMADSIQQARTSSKPIKSKEIVKGKELIIQVLFNGIEKRKNK